MWQDGEKGQAREQRVNDLADLIKECEGAFNKQIRQDKEQGWQQWEDWVCHPTEKEQGTRTSFFVRKLDSVCCRNQAGGRRERPGGD